MKKIRTHLILFIVLLALAACSGSAAESGETVAGGSGTGSATVGCTRAATMQAARK